MDILKDTRFHGIKPFSDRCWLASPTMHGDEKHWIDEALTTNWVTTTGANIDAIEQKIAAFAGVRYAVGLSAGTTALHLAVKLAGERLFGAAEAGEGTLRGRYVFCSDCTFSASANPIAYENGSAVFIDAERESWNMDPAALERAFTLYPGTKLIVLTHLYGTPAKAEAIRAIAARHGALIVEDAAESFGAQCKLGGGWAETGALGDFNCISFNGNKIITGSSGGMFLTNSAEDAAKIRKWSTQSREQAPWYQHEELGYNYRMSNIVAGVVRGQIPYLNAHIARKQEIRARYQEGLKDLPVTLNPWDPETMRPNFWLTCLLIDQEAMAPQTMRAADYTYQSAPGKSSPLEIMEALAAFGAESRPVWKPMHLQPIYSGHAFVAAESGADVGADLFRRGLCLPSDIKMTDERQDQIIEIIHRCFR